MVNPIDVLKSRITGEDSNQIEQIVNVARELHCVADIIGRTYEVYDANNKIVFRIKQKPMKITQLNALIKTLVVLNKKDKKLLKKGKR